MTKSDWKPPETAEELRKAKLKSIKACAKERGVPFWKLRCTYCYGRGIQTIPDPGGSISSECSCSFCNAVGYMHPDDRFVDLTISENERVVGEKRRRERQEKTHRACLVKMSLAELLEWMLKKCQYLSTFEKEEIRRRIDAERELRS